MTKFEWERQLKKGISGLPDSEQQRVLDYYSELFSDKIDAGMSEREIIAEFGNPYDVANKILVDFYNDGKSNPKADEYIYSSPDSIEDDEETSAAAQPTTAVVNVENQNNAAKDEKQRQNKNGGGAKFERNDKHKVKVEIHRNRGRKSFGGMVVLICTLLFFVLGAFFGLWHPGWMVFLLIPVVISLIEAIEKRNWHIFCYPVLVVIIYLLCGFYGKLWHPMWVLFITIPLYYTIGSYISKNVDSDDDEEDDDDADDDDEKPSSGKVTANPQSSSSNNTRTNGNSNGTASDKSTNVGKVIAGVLLTIILVYVMIVVWSAVIGLFCAGIGMICGGLVVLISSFASFVSDIYLGILMLGAALVLVGLGLVFTFGMASVFKYCVKMCKQFGKTISACFDAKE